MRINSEDELVKKVFSVQAAFIKLMATSVKKKSHNDDDVMGLTSVQFKLLCGIRSVEKMTVTDLADLSQTSKSSISLTLTKLEKDGFIKRIPAETDDDKRRVYMTLTEKGISATQKAQENFIRHFWEFYNSLTQEKRVILENLIDNSYKLFVEK